MTSIIDFKKQTLASVFVVIVQAEPTSATSDDGMNERTKEGNGGEMQTTGFSLYHGQEKALSLALDALRITQNLTLRSETCCEHRSSLVKISVIVFWQEWFDCVGSLQGKTVSACVETKQSINTRMNREIFAIPVLIWGDWALWEELPLSDGLVTDTTNRVIRAERSLFQLQMMYSMLQFKHHALTFPILSLCSCIYEQNPNNGHTGGSFYFETMWYMDQHHSNHGNSCSCLGVTGAEEGRFKQFGIFESNPVQILNLDIPGPYPAGWSAWWEIRHLPQSTRPPLTLASQLRQHCECFTLWTHWLNVSTFFSGRPNQCHTEATSHNALHIWLCINVWVDLSVCNTPLAQLALLSH